MKSIHRLSKIFKRALYFLVFFIVFSCGGIEDKERQDKEAFYIEDLKEYHIECDIEEFKLLNENYKENTYIPIKIKYKEKTCTAKMRIRGDTSREDPKKSLKVKFDSTSFVVDETVFNLNAEYSDKTLIRQFLSSKLIQKSGQICFNSELIKVYLNGKYLGFYLKVENVDKKFLKRNELSSKGNLYKGTKDGACLSIFDDFNAKWEKKTNKKGDHSDLTKLILDLNTIPDNKFYSFIQENFEYEQLINILSLNMFLSNGSTYYHNYYLYHDLYETGKWQLLPWDLDKTMSYYNWKPYTYHETSSEWESDNPLVERAILCQPIFEDIKKRIDELHENYLNDRYVSPIIDQLIAVIKDVVDQDTTDKIKDQKEWLEIISNEKKYFDQHYKLLQKQFNEQPLSFNVYRFRQDQTDNITFKWEKTKHKQNKSISYILSYGTDFLLLDSLKTHYIENIKDTFFTLNNELKEGTYYWKVTAFDGEHYTDGFNTKNIFQVKKGTVVSSVISTDKTFKKEKSPYLISENLVINENVTLTIEAGVEIHLKDSVNISCHGSIFSNGKKDNPVIFMPDNTTDSWGHIYFYERAKTGYFNNTIIREGTINSKETKLILDSSSILIDKKYMGEGWENRKVLIYSGKGNVHIKNSSFKSNGEGEGLVLFFGEAITENSYFENVPDAIEYIQMDKGTIRNNFVTKSPDDAIDLNACNNILIEGNILIENKDKGISIGTEQYGPSIENIKVNNNLIIGNKTAIAIKDSSVAYISNNTLFKNINGINLYKKREDYNKGGTAYIRNTIFNKNEKTNVYPDKLSFAEVNNSIVHNKILGGKDNLGGDPLFIDAKNNNFYLKTTSPCIKKGDDNKDLGAFDSGSSILSFVKIHVKSGPEKKTGDWIEIVNNHNILVDMSLYKIVIKKGEKEKIHTFPIGSTIGRLESLFVVNKYKSFEKYHGKNHSVVGGLPKLGTEPTVIQLFNSNGYLIDSYEYTDVKEKEDLTFFVKKDGNSKLK